MKWIASSAWRRLSMTAILVVLSLGRVAPAQQEPTGLPEPNAEAPLIGALEFITKAERPFRSMRPLVYLDRAERGGLRGEITEFELPELVVIGDKLTVRGKAETNWDLPSHASSTAYCWVVATRLDTGDRNVIGYWGGKGASHNWSGIAGGGTQWVYNWRPGEYRVDLMLIGSLGHPRSPRFLAAATKYMRVAPNPDHDSIVATITTDVDGSDDPDGSLKRILEKIHVDDDVLREIGRLQEVKSLGLHNQPISSHGIAAIGGLHLLEKLDISATDVDDDCLRMIAAMPGLRSLKLAGTRVTARGVCSLACCTALEELDLGGLVLDQQSLEILTAMPGLRSLELPSTPVEDEWLDSIVKVTNLKYLDLGLTSISDAGARRIATLNHLEELRLDGTALSNDGLEVLTKLPLLRRLWIGGTMVTDEAARRVQEQVPSMKLER